MEIKHDYTVVFGNQCDNTGATCQFTAGEHDVDVAYQALAQNISIPTDNKQAITKFQNCQDSNVEVMLNDLVHKGFLSSWDEELSLDNFDDSDVIPKRLSNELETQGITDVVFTKAMGMTPETWAKNENDSLPDQWMIDENSEQYMATVNNDIQSAIDKVLNNVDERVQEIIAMALSQETADAATRSAEITRRITPFEKMELVNGKLDPEDILEAHNFEY